MEQAATLTSDLVEDALAETRVRFLGELFDAHHVRLHRLARRLSGDSEEARDLVQEAFLRLARDGAADRLDPAFAEGWLVRVLVNLCRDRQRRSRVRRRHFAELGRVTEPVESFEPAAIARATVQAALSRLPARRRAVVVLCELEELGTAEVSRLLRMSRVTVRWHLHAARKQLKAILCHEGKSS